MEEKFQNLLRHENLLFRKTNQSDTEDCEECLTLCLTAEENVMLIESLIESIIFVCGGKVIERENEN